MYSVPANLVRYAIREDEIVPSYFGASDSPWLREVIETFDTLVGATRHEVELRLRRPAHARLFAIAVHILWQIYKTRVVAAVPPRRAREALFTAAARGDREGLLAGVAAELGTGTDQLTAAMFADLPRERRLSPPTESVSPDQLALHSNTAITRAILRRALHVEITLAGNARAVVRHAKLRGLICTVAGSDGDAKRMSLSGPLALFRHTTMYGRALAELVPILAWCPQFRLVARCGLGREENPPLRFVVTKSSPILPSKEPRRYDSKLEERFARDLARATAAWQLTREPEPVEARGTLIFPDFELRHAHDPKRRWWVEIVGFWTLRYIEEKLASLRAAHLDRLILCIDRARACDVGQMPDHARIVWFERRIDVSLVLAIVEADIG